MGRHEAQHTSARAIVITFIGLGLAAWWVAPALAARPGPAVAAVLKNCGFSALKEAVAEGGTVNYGTDCSSTPVSFTETITVPSGLTVDIAANGHSVTFNGNFKVRLFHVTGGKLTIGGITLEQGEATTAAGHPGTSGGNRTSGSAGLGGAKGADGSPPGADGAPGQPGSKPTGGEAGTAGGNGKLTRGSALLITSGTVALSNDTFVNDVASADGGGATGGNGGTGAPGGGGGNAPSIVDSHGPAGTGGKAGAADTASDSDQN